MPPNQWYEFAYFTWGIIDPKRKDNMYCKCYDVLLINNAVKDIVDEVKEFVSEPSKDELSDIAFGVNRLFGALLKKMYVKVIPGDGMHIRKIELRMQEYGCVRSRRHLVNDRCPS